MGASDFHNRLRVMGYTPVRQRYEAATNAAQVDDEIAAGKRCTGCAHSSWQAQSPRVAGGKPSRVLACRQAAGAYVREMSLCQQWQPKEGGAV